MAGRTSATLSIALALRASIDAVRPFRRALSVRLSGVPKRFSLAFTHEIRLLITK